MELRMTSSVPSPPSAAGMDVTCASGMTSSAAFFMMAQRRAEERLPLKESGISRIFTIRFRSEKSAGGLRARPEPHRRPHPHASDGVREKKSLHHIDFACVLYDSRPQGYICSPFVRTLRAPL